MRLRSLACTLALALSALGAAGPDARAAETVLHLSETATLFIAPDELAATLRAEATASRASDAQSQVNAMVKDALAAAAALPDIQAATGGYHVWRVPPTPQDRAEKWQGSQVLMLHARDGAALLTLIGALQQKGLVVGGLQWRLAHATDRQARLNATKQALAALRGRTEEAAEILGLQFNHFRAVRLDGAEPPVPMPRAMMAARPRAAEAVPPVAVAEDIPVTATAQAEAVLLPR
jgi:predicted secreted protein